MLSFQNFTETVSFKLIFQILTYSVKQIDDNQQSNWVWLAQQKPKQLQIDLQAIIFDLN